VVRRAPACMRSNIACLNSSESCSSTITPPCWTEPPQCWPRLARLSAPVTDGPTALEAARTLQPDVIVLDISMPGMSGLDVAQSLKAVGSTAAVVFLTVHDDAEVMAAAKAAGGIRYVMKPRLVVDLARAVREASSGRPFESTIP